MAIPVDTPYIVAGEAVLRCIGCERLAVVLMRPAAMRAEPEVSGPVLEHAEDHSRGEAGRGDLNLALRERERDERFAIKSADPAMCADPEGSGLVQHHAPHAVVAETVRHRVVLEYAGLVATDSAVRSEPHGTALVLHDSSNGVTAEALLHAEVSQRLPVVAADAVAIGAEPEIPIPVLENLAHIFTDLLIGKIRAERRRMIASRGRVLRRRDDGRSEQCNHKCPMKC